MAPARTVNRLELLPEERICPECCGAGTVEAIVGSVLNGLGGPGGYDPDYAEVRCDRCYGRGAVEIDEDDEEEAA